MLVNTTRCPNLFSQTSAHCIYSNQNNQTSFTTQDTCTKYSDIQQHPNKHLRKHPNKFDEYPNLDIRYSTARTT